MAELPTGTVTFLFTDIEGSTRLLRELGDQYPAVLAEQRRAIRQACAAHAGFEVDTQGDSFFFAFARATDAIAAAAEAQRALAKGPIRIRMGLHTGEPLVTDDGYVGMDVHRAARIAAVGHGGQVLISQTTRDLVSDQTTDLGEHRLKDLTDHERLFQLGEREFPPLRSLNWTNIPVPSTALVGRELELDRAAELIRGNRVVSLVGPPGTGKTRLALAVAANAVEEFEGGVFWVSLGSLHDHALVLPTIAQTVGAKGRVANHFQHGPALLLLDNMEQLLEAASDLAQLLAVAESLKLLITSREALHIGGEQEYRVPPLSTEEAVALFTERARAVRPGFVADEVVVEICRRLDGLPLAIELAAPRLKMLEPTALLERLDRRLPVLSGGRRDAPERQRTLRATVEWSYDLLAEDDQRLLARLGVFAGGFGLDAAEEVCDAMVDSLASLVDKSLLTYEQGRLSMLETIREFAEERLEASEEAEVIRDRHADHYGRCAEETDSRIRGPEQNRLLDRLEMEHDNMRAAFSWLLGVDPTGALRLVLHLDRFLVVRNHLREAAHWYSEALGRSESVDPALRAHALREAGDVEAMLDETERARTLWQQSLAFAQKAGSKELTADALLLLGSEEEALRLFRELGNHIGVAEVLAALGEQAKSKGDFATGRRHLEEAERLIRQHQPFAFWLPGVLHSQGDCALAEDSLDEAARLYREALALARGLGAERIVVYCLAGLAGAAAKAGHPQRAARLWGAVEALEDSSEVRIISDDRQYYERIFEDFVRKSSAGRAYEEGRAMSAAGAMDYALSTVN